MNTNLKTSLLTLLFVCAFIPNARATTNVSFPYNPIGVASWPWWIAKEAGYFEKQGLDVDMIKATMEGTRRMFTNKKFSKTVLAKYTRQAEAEVLDQSYRFARDIYVKVPTVTPSSIRPIVQQAAEWNQIDAKLASTTPTSACYDNSYIDEIKKSGIFTQL